MKPDKNDIYQAALKRLHEALGGSAAIDHFKVEVQEDGDEIVPQKGSQLSLVEMRPTKFVITIKALTPWGQQMLRRANLSGMTISS